MQSGQTLANFTAFSVPYVMILKDRLNQIEVHPAGTEESVPEHLT
jgi:hypothetical protein